VFHFQLAVPWLLSTTIVASSAPVQPPLPDIPSVQPPLTPIVRVNYDYYPLNGSTAKELQAEMLQHGPLLELEERHYDAYTHWHVRWSYDYTRTGEGCAITDVESSVDVTFTLPWWNVPAEASGSVVAAWNQFLGALQLHENVHMSHGVAAATEIMQTLNQFPVYGSCQALQAAVSSTTQDIIQYYNQQDIDYDRWTQHGLTQGAVFPPYQPSARQEPLPSQ
jgi:predicted secreted Zn-dependent protease